MQRNVTEQAWIQRQDSRERKAVLERGNRVCRLEGSGTRGNSGILDRQSKIQDVA
jgi:hypothetical protein